MQARHTSETDKLTLARLAVDAMAEYVETGWVRPAVNAEALGWV
ncbi:MAG TPA: hypothetical protein VGP31_12820 [Planosporangium sp.]|nr:hypothetical protein [Planosporangium sp.]